MIADLGDRELDPIGAIRAAASKGIPVLAFGSHVDEAALEAAREAGASRVVPRSVFASRLPELIAELAGKGRIG